MPQCLCAMYFWIFLSSSFPWSPDLSLFCSVTSKLSACVAHPSPLYFHDLCGIRFFAGSSPHLFFGYLLWKMDAENSTHAAPGDYGQLLLSFSMFPDHRRVLFSHCNYKHLLQNHHQNQNHHHHHHHQHAHHYQYIKKCQHPSSASPPHTLQPCAVR